MNKLCLMAFMGVLGLAALTPEPADARVFVHVGFGGGYYGPGWGPYYRPYYYPAYYPPYYAPPVVYAAPPTVVYTQPSAVAYAAPIATEADQTSPTFIDAQGRTCRQFTATSAGPSAGTACLLSDGTWRVVQ
jgi:hypothetical protein